MRTAIITGGSSGIGLAAAKSWNALGWQVLLVGRRADALQNAAAALPSPAPVSTFVADCTKPEELEKLAEFIRKKNFSPQALLHAAGSRFTGSWESTSSADWQNALEQNLSAAFYTVQALAPLLVATAKKEGQAAITLIASALGQKPTAHMLAYSVAKAGIIQLTKNLALELSGQKVRVNCVVPAAVDTPMLRGSADTEQFKKFLPTLAENHALGRIGQPEEIARAIQFLSDPQNSWITGSILTADGGFSLV